MEEFLALVSDLITRKLYSRPSLKLSSDFLLKGQIYFNIFARKCPAGECDGIFTGLPLRQTIVERMQSPTKGHIQGPNLHTENGRGRRQPIKLK